MAIDTWVTAFMEKVGYDLRDPEHRYSVTLGSLPSGSRLPWEKGRQCLARLGDISVYHAFWRQAMSERGNGYQPGPWLTIGTTNKIMAAYMIDRGVTPIIQNLGTLPHGKDYDRFLGTMFEALVGAIEVETDWATAQQYVVGMYLPFLWKRYGRYYPASTDLTSSQQHVPPINPQVQGSWEILLDVGRYVLANKAPEYSVSKPDGLHEGFLVTVSLDGHSESATGLAFVHTRDAAAWRLLEKLPDVPAP